MGNSGNCRLLRRRRIQTAVAAALMPVLVLGLVAHSCPHHLDHDSTPHGPGEPHDHHASAPGEHASRSALPPSAPLACACTDTCPFTLSAGPPPTRDDATLHCDDTGIGRRGAVAPAARSSTHAPCFFLSQRASQSRLRVAETTGQRFRTPDPRTPRRLWGATQGEARPEDLLGRRDGGTNRTATESNGDALHGHAAGHRRHCGLNDEVGPGPGGVELTSRQRPLRPSTWWASTRTSGAKFMRSYHFLRMTMEGNRIGTERINVDKVQETCHLAPVDIGMGMHMAGLMYAPGDIVTLPAMGNRIDHFECASAPHREPRSPLRPPASAT